jgi:hypothetical protein
VSNVDNTVLSELLNIQTRVILSVLSVHMFPEDGVNSAVRHVDNTVFIELLNTHTSVILSVFKCSIYSPEDCVNSHRNMPGVL